jgi:hypothetical protein
MSGNPGNPPGMVKGMPSGTVSDKPSGMVNGTLPKSRGDAFGRGAVAGARPAAGPLGVLECGASSTTLLSTSIGSSAPVGSFGEPIGLNSLPRELPPRVRCMTAVASARSPSCMRRIASAIPPCIWSLMVMFSSLQHLSTIQIPSIQMVEYTLRDPCQANGANCCRKSHVGCDLGTTNSGATGWETSEIWGTTIDIGPLRSR